MKVVHVESAKYDGHGGISVMVQFEEREGEVGELLPFSASPYDPEEHGRLLYAALEAGEYGEIKPYTEANRQQDLHVQRTTDCALQIAEADRILSALSDERDADIISDADLARWKRWVKYRKQLRELDLTADVVTWPARPE